MCTDTAVFYNQNNAVGNNPCLETKFEDLIICVVLTRSVQAQSECLGSQQDRFRNKNGTPGLGMSATIYGLEVWPSEKRWRRWHVTLLRKFRIWWEFIKRGVAIAVSWLPNSKALCSNEMGSFFLPCFWISFEIEDRGQSYRGQTGGVND